MFSRPPLTSSGGPPTKHRRPPRRAGSSSIEAIPLGHVISSRLATPLGLFSLKMPICLEALKPRRRCLQRVSPTHSLMQCRRDVGACIGHMSKKPLGGLRAFAKAPEIYASSTRWATNMNTEVSILERVRRDVQVQPPSHGKLIDVRGACSYQYDGKQGELRTRPRVLSPTK